MSGENKFWRLPIPSRRGLFRKQQKSNVERSGNHVPNVYLSNDSTGSFVVVPEFIDPLRSQTKHEPSSAFNLPTGISSLSSGNGVGDSLPGFQSQRSSHFYPGSHSSSFFCTDDDLPHRLCSAYEYIHSMPCTSQPSDLLSSDPRILRKQLGVPQHSVLNYPIHSSLDLPNPHTHADEPTSVLLADAPYARSPGSGLHIDASTHSESSCPLSYPFRLAARVKSVGTTPTPTDNVIKTPWHTRIACVSDPQLYIPRPPKRYKRDVEKSLPSHLLSSHRKATSDILQEPVIDTLQSSSNATVQKSLLPQIRPPSPFRINMPLYHTWHDRRTNFNSSLGYQPEMGQPHTTTANRTRESTEILASLAWTGTPPIASDLYIADRNRQHTRASLFPGHLSMAIAAEDDSLSDDILIDRLEKARKIGGERGIEERAIVSSEENGSCNTSFLLCSPSASDQSTKPQKPSMPLSLISNDSNSEEDNEVWKAARKALLCVREIIRTERKYQEALRLLLSAQTATPPPPSMAPYVSALICTSERLLKYFFEDPSAWGVSTAFVTTEEELEASMVSWCSVAGTFFADGNNLQSGHLSGKWSLRKSGLASSSSSVTKQFSAYLGPQLPPIFTTSNSANDIAEQMIGKTRASKPWSRWASTNERFSRKPSVRDLAIQPIQRVMRYVLLYRDLLDCTPSTSPSRLLVERALEAATHIANRCDTAQRNPAFCYAS